MLRSRIIPCLLVRNKGLVKTVEFKEGKYVGDPINAVKIFNDKEVDEIVVLDIDATKESREPDYKMIKNLANESRMPLCYGGGITNAEQALEIIHLGVEKVAIGAEALKNPKVISEIAHAIGSQSVVVVLDVKKKGITKKYTLTAVNGTEFYKKNIVEYAQEAEKLGAGELLINSIDNDGKMMGYDKKLIKIVRDAVDIPITALGGAGKLDDIKDLIDDYGIIGAAAGSLFVFKGKYKAVLINYPTREQHDELTHLATKAN